jgi:hypothetical protein
MVQLPRAGSVTACGKGPVLKGQDFREPLNKYPIQENHPSGTKARVDYADFSGTAEAVPF